VEWNDTVGVDRRKGGWETVEWNDTVGVIIAERMVVNMGTVGVAVSA